MEFSRYQRTVRSVHARPGIASDSSRGIRGSLPKFVYSLEEAHFLPGPSSTRSDLAGLSDMETYNGHVRTPADAIILFEACRLGLLPRVQRRLSEKERQSIKSGSVFVWDEREAGMRRWTDGKSWSASRVSGSFLTYREMEGKRGGNNFGPPLAAVSRAGKTPDSTRGSDSDLEMAGEDGPDGYRYKPDGLMKQSFSITTSSGNHLHLISYYSRSHPAASNLSSPTSDPQLRHIRPQKGMYPESTVHENQNIPAVTRSPMISAPFSTVPQMAGYARQGPPQWSPHYNGYGWAPPPMQQPQTAQYNGYQYSAGQFSSGPSAPPSGNYTGAPPPPTNGHSPLSQAQSAQQSSMPHPNDQNNMRYDQRRYSTMSAPVNPHGFDSRNGTRPTAHPQHFADAYRPLPDQNPAYDPRYPSNQYRTTAPLPENLAPPPPQQQNRVSHNTNGLQPMTYQQSQMQPQLQSSPSPMSHVTGGMQPPQFQHTNAPSTPIDPRLFAPSPSAPQQIPINPESRTSTPGNNSHEKVEPNASYTNGVSQTSTIPSIGTIMKGASSDNVNSPNADARSDISGDRTPGGSAKKESVPKDIPSDKMGFGEDMRALKVLDRAFKT